jgi:hypothetical protein
MCVCIYILYMYVHTHTHMYIVYLHTHTHTHTHRCAPCGKTSRPLSIPSSLWRSEYTVQRILSIEILHNKCLYFYIMKYLIHHISRTLIFRFGDVRKGLVYHAPSPGISNTNFSRWAVQSWATFRIGFSSNASTIQQNPVRNVAKKIPFPGKNPRRRPDSVSNLFGQKNASARRAAAFVHRSPLFLLLPVLEGMISAVLLHPAQNPLMSVFCQFFTSKINVRILGIVILYSIKVLVCRLDFWIPTHTEIRPCFVFDLLIFC